MRRSRPRSWGVACCTVLALVAGAVTAAGASVRSHAPVITGRSGGHLTIVSVQASGTWVGMDPFLDNIPPATAAMFPAFDSLFDVDPTTNAVLTNSLATGYHVLNGGRTITIALRRNVKFQDGTVFNAQAVVWNLERSMSTTVGSECQPELTVLSSVVATGPYQVTLHLNSRDAGLIPLLATQPCALMASPTAYNSEGSNFTNEPVGTGPFAYSGGVPGSLANFTRFNGYWGGRPHLNEVTVEAVNSDDAALAALRSGSAQAWVGFVDTGAVPDILQAKHIANLVVTTGPAASITYVAFAFNHAPFNNLSARQLVTAATNAKAIDATLYHNLFRPIQGIFPPSSWAYSGGVEKNYPSYDPQRVSSLLEKLGSVAFTMLVANTPSQLQLAEALQAQWQSVGINAQISPVTTAALVTDLHTLNYQALLTNSPGLPDPDNMVYPWFYSTSSLTQDGLSDPTVDKYIRSGRADYGEPARKASYMKLNSVLSALTPWDDIAATNPYNIVAKTVKGIPATPYSRFPWESIYLS